MSAPERASGLPCRRREDRRYSGWRRRFPAGFPPTALSLARSPHGYDSSCSGRRRSSSPRRCVGARVSATSRSRPGEVVWVSTMQNFVAASARKIASAASDKLRPVPITHCPAEDKISSASAMVVLLPQLPVTPMKVAPVRLEPRPGCPIVPRWRHQDPRGSTRQRARSRRAIPATCKPLASQTRAALACPRITCPTIDGRLKSWRAWLPPLPLPQRVVGVLNAQGRQGRLLAM